MFLRLMITTPYSQLFYRVKTLFFISITGIFIIPYLLSGCSGPDSSVLTEEKMVDVATDIHLVEAGIKFIRRTEPVDDAQVYKAFDSVFRKNNITKEQYEQSMDYYQSHPEKLDKIYTEVITRLSTMQNSRQPGKTDK